MKNFLQALAGSKDVTKPRLLGFAPNRYNDAMGKNFLELVAVKKRWLIGLVLLVTLPVLAAAPRALSVVINGYPVKGKALWYKGKVYVPLEEVAAATGGSYRYNPATGLAEVTVGLAAAPARREVVRPYIKVRWEKKYLTGNNAKVLATISNTGDTVAENVEAICIFKDGNLREVTAVTRDVGRLMPGENRTLEFNLFDGYVVNSYGAPIVADGMIHDKILLNGEWTRVSYELKFNYQ